MECSTSVAPQFLKRLGKLGIMSSLKLSHCALDRMFSDGFVVNNGLFTMLRWHVHSRFSTIHELVTSLLRDARIIAVPRLQKRIGTRYGNAVLLMPY